MPMHEDFAKVHKKFISEYGEEKGNSLYYAWVNKHKYEDTKSMGEQGKKEFRECFEGNLELKESEGNAYSSGYIATTHPDRLKDIFTKSVLDKWANDINNPKGNNIDAYAVSLHHDRNDIQLVGVATQAQVKELEDGNYGLWVETKHNKTHPMYEKLNYEVENKFIGGYSVEFKTNDSYKQTINGNNCRVITDATLHGYGFAGPRTIVNPEARIEEFAVKEIVSFEELNAIIENELPVLDSKEKTITEEIKMETKEVPKSDALEAKETTVAVAEVKEKTYTETEFKEKVKAIFNELQMKEKPMINPGDHFEKKEELEVKEVVNFHKAIETNNTNLMFKEATKLMNKFPSIFSRSVNSNRDIKDPSRMEFKALTKTTNEASQYYQAVAELNDVYDPIITPLLNDKTTLWGMLAKDDYSGRQMIQFRVITSGITAGGYAEGDSTWTATNTTRKKMEQDFCNYRATVEVTGQMIASSSGGGIGDVFSQEVERATVDLRKQLNLDLLTGSAATYTGADDSHILGLQLITASTGTIYGRARSGNTYIQGTTEAMGSVDLTLAQLRKMIRTVIVNGANRNDLVFVTSYTQVDKYRSIIQGMQQVVPDASRVGFEGLPAFDGIPIMPDAQATAGDLFLLNLGTNGVRVGVQVAPTLTEFGITGDTRKAFIKTYFQVYCKDLRLNYLSSGLATT